MYIYLYYCTAYRYNFLYRTAGVPYRRCTVPPLGTAHRTAGIFVPYRHIFLYRTAHDTGYRTVVSLVYRTAHDTDTVPSYLLCTVPPSGTGYRTVAMYRRYVPYRVAFCTVPPSGTEYRTAIWYRIPYRAS